MSSEWRTLSLGELGRIVTGKTPPTARPDFFGGHIPFLTPTDMVDGQKAVQATRTLTDAGLATVKNCLVPRGIAVSCIGWQMGKSVLVLEPTVTNQQINTLIVDESRFNLSFVYYLLANMRDRIFELGATPTRTPIVNKSTFSRIAVQIPSLDEQKKIAAFGAMFDDRITLLRETNATLEAIAQALFKSWFIDFDPVHAKQQGRAPEGMDEATAALFPDSFEESELGLVPKGWRVGVLGDLVAIRGGKQLEKEFFDETATNPIFGGAGVMGKTCLKNATGFVITVGRVGAYCGQFFWCLGDAWVNNNSSHIEPISLPQSVWIYQWLKAANIDHIKKGAAQPFVSNGDLAQLKMVIPSDGAVSYFVEVVAPSYDRMNSLQQQAQTLATLRDTLLPRLISGQLRLPEAEALLTEAMP